MDIDLSRKTQLTADERMAIATELHAALLDEIFRATGWRREDAVFHGGTSLRVGHGSPRFSEDLDFMASVSALADLSGRVRRAFSMVAERAASMLPGSALELKERVPKDRSEDGGEDAAAAAEREGVVRCFEVRWTHPMRHGKVSVKIEFYTTNPEALRRYRASEGLLGAVGAGSVRVTTPVPLAELRSIWADKIKAIAAREAFKWRDAHDLGYVTLRLRRDGALPAGAEAMDLIRATAAVYDFPLARLAEGLERVAASGVFADPAGFEDDMARWFDPETHARMVRAGIFRRLLETAAGETARALDLVLEHCPEARPAPAPAP